MSKYVSDTSRVALWLSEPRVQLAYLVSDLGLAITRLAGKISDEPIADIGREVDDPYATGYRLGQERTMPPQ